jgi:hypothetical protein
MKGTSSLFSVRVSIFVNNGRCPNIISLTSSSSAYALCLVVTPIPHQRNKQLGANATYKAVTLIAILQNYSLTDRIAYRSHDDVERGPDRLTLFYSGRSGSRRDGRDEYIALWLCRVDRLIDVEQTRCEPNGEPATIVAIARPLPKIVGCAAKARHEKPEFRAGVMGDEPLNLIAHRLDEVVALLHGDDTKLPQFLNRAVDSVAQFAWVVELK